MASPVLHKTDNTSPGHCWLFMFESSCAGRINSRKARMSVTKLHPASLPSFPLLFLCHKDSNDLCTRVEFTYPKSDIFSGLCISNTYLNPAHGRVLELDDFFKVLSTWSHSVILWYHTASSFGGGTQSRVGLTLHQSRSNAAWWRLFCVLLELLTQALPAMPSFE